MVRIPKFEKFWQNLANPSNFLQKMLFSQDPDSTDTFYKKEASKLKFSLALPLYGI